MDVRGESVRDPEERPAARDACPAGPEAPLPDLLELDLAELRTIQHPVLREVLDELRERAARPSEMLWGFNNAF
ncbi:FxSxx-COOH cyclophane-containing RiPP peptide [Streptomyces bluensis]|uniref:FxSxx-COOH cyclophane-containing RiPP peptide n=1 Tax=Streptomyces bluensis TaxID=33897 RepID=UPI0033199EFF